MDALRRGGSSVDAALAAAFTQWAVSSPVCGPGGDLFVLHVEGDDVTTYGGWSSTPARLDPTAELPARGGGSAVVPGALAGAEAAWRAAGRLPWRSLFTDAVAHAEGHEVTPWMAASYASCVAKGQADALEAVIGRRDAPAVGETVACPDLGRSLGRIAEAGAAALRDGALGAEVAAAAEADGLALRADDLAAVTAQVAPGERTDLGDCTVTVPGAPSQAGIAAQLLAAVDPAVDPASTAFCAAVAPLTRDLLVERCTVGLPGTAVSMAADATSTAVVVHSLAGVQYGSGWVARGTGIALGNRVGTALSTRADLPAANPVPGAVVPHTLSAAVVRLGGVDTVVATPGGDRQVQWLAQAVQRVRRSAPLPVVVGGPRWFVCPEGDRFGVPGGIGSEWFCFAEPGIAWAGDPTVAGFAVRPVDWVGGGLQAIARGPRGIHPAGDPRGGGTAATTDGGTVGALAAVGPAPRDRGDIDV
ncbi:MAG TPA: gamma-glutamyltransferase [Iamia sp.]|nr:gamma-glutamyltransferase [Iamia sp.]